MKSFADACNTQADMLEDMFKGQTPMTTRLELEGFSDEDIDQFCAFVDRSLTVMDLTTLYEALRGRDPEDSYKESLLRVLTVTLLVGIDIGQSKERVV